MSAAFDNVGISDNSNPSVADFDGTGESFSAQALTARSPTALTSGSQATIGGTTFSWPAAGVAAQRDRRWPGHRRVRDPVPTSASSARPGFGEATGTGTITYTDGSTQSFSLSMPDWYNNAAEPG